MKNLHLLSELHLFHLFCYMRNLPFLIAFSFALIYQRNSVAFTIGIHQNILQNKKCWFIIISDQRD